MIHAPKNILVTGGMGFIGSNFIDLTLTSHPKVEIINIDKLTYAASAENVSRINELSRHHFIQGDICDAEFVKNIFRQYEIDTVVHFAAESHVDNSITGPKEFIESNIVGTFNLIEQARGYWGVKDQTYDGVRFHHVSTDEVYGSISKNSKPVNEEAVYNPSSPYSASKASSDHIVTAYYKTYGLPVTMSHCSNNYGMYQNNEKFIPVVIEACKNNKNIPIYGDGSNVRDWIHVTDHCLAIWAILTSGKVGSKYNVPGNYEISNLNLAKKICNILDEEKPANSSYIDLLAYVPDRLGHDWRYAISGEKISKDCMWSPQISFDAGLRDTVLWYLDRT